MTAKEITFAILNKLKKGTQFTGYQLMKWVRERGGGLHYPDTILRYMREYRQATGRRVLNVDKPKSLYEVIG